MPVSTKGHRWGVVAQSPLADIEYCPLCKRYRNGSEYISKRDIPADAQWL